MAEMKHTYTYTRGHMLCKLHVQAGRGQVMHTYKGYRQNQCKPCLKYQLLQDSGHALHAVWTNNAHPQQGCNAQCRVHSGRGGICNLVGRAVDATRTRPVGLTESHGDA
mmetsp:Transcript_24628/g.63466  ORF Transcript_24628/g.63466 Transcript_24628/m.63466 type:complete len:109 (-) Transcript_24628:145-471(-)|eukprot:819454-Pelagomonas_calceolata.AAC.6